MNIVIFDGYTINPGDLSWDKIDALCDRLTVFDATPMDKALLRLGNSEVLFTSKCPITRELMEKAPNLKYIGCTATGYNNIDLAYGSIILVALIGLVTYNIVEAIEHKVVLWKN